MTARSKLSRFRLPRTVRIGRFLSLRSLAATTLFVNTAFPKGGFYLGGVPLTWGYLLLGVTGTLCVGALLLGRFKLDMPLLLSLTLILGYTVYSGVALVFSGYDASVSLGFLLSYCVSISVIPIFALLTTSYLLKKVGLKTFLATLKAAFSLVVVWGLVHFVAMNALGTFIGVPYVTTTGAQLDITTTRSVNRGSVLKMVSTYNNGNILGVNLLLWFPVVLAGGRRLKKRVALPARLLFLLSLSRTVWAGWIVSEVLLRVYGLRKLKSLLVVFVLVPVAAGLVVAIATVWFDNPLAFIFDASLGGRRAQLDQAVGLLPQPFNGIREIVYTSVATNFGVLGLLLFVATWGFPLLLPVKTRAARLAKVGLMTYFFLMLSDGAFILIPTQYTYWMVAAVVCSDAFLGEA